MRDFSNAPTLHWNHETEAPYRAKAQVLMKEPIIIAMPDRLRYTICATDFGCRFDHEAGMLFDCDAASALARLSENNFIPGLRLVAEAAEASGARLDIDPHGHRLIIHD